MVSSKCCQVESPSPFVFTAPLIPPWAQTEWERFTGTTEKRSTGTPASAILIVAMRPARPPPTTMILGLAINFYQFKCRGRPCVYPFEGATTRDCPLQGRTESNPPHK